MKLILLVIFIASAIIANVYSHPQEWPIPLENSVSIEGRIVNGTLARNNQFPHQGWIRVANTVSSNNYYLCSGSLISTRWVITAGHCVKGRAKFLCGFGTNNLATATVISLSYTAYVHPNYNPSTLANDVGVILLSAPVPNIPGIAVIRLPKVSQASTTFVNVKAKISGWGKISDPSTVASIFLRWANLNIISNLNCGLHYGTGVIKPSMMCGVGWPNIYSNACNGDDGGPLSIIESGVNTLVGVFSFRSGLGCSSGRPAVYSRLSSQLSWIATTTGIPPR